MKAYARRTRPRMSRGFIPPGPPMPRRAPIISFSLWRSAARDATEDEAPRRDPSSAPAERRADLLDRIRVRRLAGDMDLRVRLSALDAVPDLRVQDHAGPQIDRIALLLTTRTQAYRGGADAVRGDRSDERGATRDQVLHARRTRQAARVIDGTRVAPLRGHELAELREPAAVGQGAIDRGERALRVARPAPTHEHLRTGEAHELQEIRGTAAAQGLDRLGDLERVTHGAPERLLHVGELAGDCQAVRDADRGQRARGREILHERAAADLYVEHDGVRAGGDLLGHDARRDQWKCRDRARRVAQRVEEPVRWSELFGLPGDDDADPPELREELRGREIDTVARERLELVERSAREAEAAPAHLRDGKTARRNERRDDESRLVPHSAGGVLVDDATEAREIEALARADHARGQRCGLLRIHAAPDHRHEEGRHLVVGDLALGVPLDEVVDLLGGELPTVALSLDELDDPH